MTLALALYTNSLTRGGTLLADFSARAKGGKFGSNKHGFSTCSFFVPMTLDESFVYYDRPGTPWVYVSWNGTGVWEGRAEDIAINNSGITVAAFGAWRYFLDGYYTGTHTSATAQAIAQALVADVAALNPALSSNTALIQNPGVTLTEVYTRKRHADILDRLCLLGDDQTPPRVWEACVWEDALLSFRPRASAGRTWYVDATALSVNRTLNTLINRAVAVYNGPANVPTETSAANDTDSQVRNDLIRAAAVSVQTEDATLAAKIRDLYLADNKDPKPATGFEFNALYDATGTRWPLWAARAGDVLVARNLPLTVSASVDKLRSFVMAEVEYDIDANALHVAAETPTPALDVFAARQSGQAQATGEIAGAGDGVIAPPDDGETPSYIESNQIISVPAGTGFADNLYYSGGWKYVGNGYGFYIKESANGIEFYTAPNNVSGAGAAATLTLRAILGLTGYVYTNNGQFDTGLIIQASSHATSERAAILYGDQWLVGQDAAGDGTKNFFVYHALTAYSPIRISVGDGVALGKASLATNATDGFIYIPACAGVPTGVPATVTGMVPLVFDTTNNRLYAYRGGAWAFVAV